MNQVITNNTTNTTKDLHRFIIPNSLPKTASPTNIKAEAAIENETIN